MMEFGLHHQNCIEGMRSLPEQAIDLTVTSPPYDDMRMYHDSSTWNKETFEQVATELYRITKIGGIVVWIVADQSIDGDETGTSFRQALYFKEIGFKLLDTMIWSKGSFSYPSNNHYPQTFEYMFIFSKGKPKTFHGIKDRRNIHAGRKLHLTYRQKDGSIIRPDLSRRTNLITSDYGVRFNVWNIPSEKHNVTGHPAVFPLDLAADHIRSWSEEGDSVLDPFAGSGTTAIACAYLNRNFIGYEIDQAYYEMACQHIQDSTAQLQLFHPDWEEKDGRRESSESAGDH